MNSVMKGEGRLRSDQAHVRAIQSDLVNVVLALIETLGKSLVAVIVGRDAKTVGRWGAGSNEPGEREEALLRNTLQIVELLTSVDSPSVARAWFMGMNPQLDDNSPAEVVAEGRIRDVMAAARLFVDNG
jgi:hypothetical protein